MNPFRKIEDKEEWQRLLDRALFKTFFHTLEWESFLEGEFHWLKFERYIYQPQGTPQALLSLARYKIGSKEKLISHPFCEYGGPLPLVKNINFLHFQKDLQELTSSVSSLKISFHPEVLTYLNYLNNVHITSLLRSSEVMWIVGRGNRESYFLESFDRKTKEKLWQGLRKTTKQEIKKAQNSGLRIDQCSNGKELKILYELYLAKSKQHRIPAYPFSFFKYFLHSEQAEIVLAKLKNKIVAGSVFLKYSGFLHYFLNTSFSGVEEVKGANHLLLWQQLSKYCQSVFSVFDLGGTRVGSSLAVFKKGWGVNRQPIYEIKNFKEEQTKKFGPLRKIWGLLPKTAIKFLSPYFLKYKL